MKKVAAVAAGLGMLAFATPAFAAVNSSRITINVTNRGSIQNVTQADSHTGNNIALGSTGGSGGTGGDVTNSGGGNENNGGASAGNGVHVVAQRFLRATGKPAAHNGRLEENITGELG